MVLRKFAALTCTALSCIAAAGAFTLAGNAPGFAQAQERDNFEPFTMAIRRITESQYRNIIRDTFGPGLTINARFEPEMREEGLQAIGAAQLSVTSSGFEQYFSLASSIASQVLDPKNRARFVTCQPADPKTGGRGLHPDDGRQIWPIALPAPADECRGRRPRGNRCRRDQIVRRLLRRPAPRSGQPAHGPRVPVPRRGGRARFLKAGPVPPGRLYQGLAPFVSAVGLRT